MNDDLIVLITLFNGEGIHKISAKIKHGLNEFEGWQYYGEPEIEAKWNKIIPSYAAGKIVAIEEIFDHVSVD